MGGYVQTGSSYSVQVLRGVTTLSSGATYNSGETLSVKLNSGTPQYVIEAFNATFTSGSPKCSNTRIYNTGGNLLMPTDGVSVVHVHAVTATGFVPVKRTADIILVPSSVAVTPVLSPTATPTLPTNNSIGLGFRVSVQFNMVKSRNISFF